MPIRMADLPAQHAELLPELTVVFQDVLRTGMFINGPHAKNLERDVAALCGSGYGLGLNSGTDALLMALLAAGVGPGDEVITTPFTFVATAETICLAGATPVFADIDPATFNLDPAAAASKITPKTKAIIPVHLFGLPADMTAFQALAQKHGLVIIADGAQSIGAEYRGKPLGAWSDFLTLSFFPTKNMGACGDAGMVLTDNADHAEKIRLLRSHGSGGTYRYKEVGYCSRLDELQAALLTVKLPKLGEWTETRRQHAARFDRRLQGLEPKIILPRPSPDSTHVYHQYTVRIPAGQREHVQTALQAADVFPAIYYPGAIHLEPAYAYLGYERGQLPESERAADEVLSLPIHPNLSGEQIDHVADALCKIVGTL